jgi:hypothetical protein
MIRVIGLSYLRRFSGAIGGWNYHSLGRGPSRVFQPRHHYSTSRPGMGKFQGGGMEKKTFRGLAPIQQSPPGEEAPPIERCARIWCRNPRVNETRISTVSRASERRLPGRRCDRRSGPIPLFPFSRGPFRKRRRPRGMPRGHTRGRRPPRLHRGLPRALDVSDPPGARIRPGTKAAVQFPRVHAFRNDAPGTAPG